MDINVGELVAEMKKAGKAIVNADLEVLRGFSERQLSAIAKQTALVAKGIATGEIEDNEKDFFLDSIENMVINFANTLRGLLVVTIEKLWNALVNVVWQAINKAIGIALFISPGALV